MGFVAAQRLTHTASPRLQHAVRLLQMSSLEFAALVRGALDTNPFLEADEGVAELQGIALGEVPATDNSTAQSGEHGTAQHDLAREGRDLWQTGPGGGSGPGSAVDGELGALERTPMDISLASHLCDQLRLVPMSNRDLTLACSLACSLDDDGYLRLPLEDALDGLDIDPPPDEHEMRIALCRVQALDPAGVGARDVQECLTLQLPAIVCPAQRTLAGAIVRDHLGLLAARDVTRLGRALGEPGHRVEAACDAIRRFDPRPGWRFGSSRIDYVVPDVIARKQGGQWRVTLNPAVVPRVRVNEVYAALFQRHREPQHAEMASHLAEARWTMRCVRQRYATILDVAQAIVRRQQLFFDLGPMAMKPLALRDIAQELGVHESTISRVTNNKYIDTPTGAFELKRFFSRPMLSSNGRACSGTAIRGLIAEMVQAETPQAPLSDVAICRQLAEQGLDVARRTVTKCRQMLRIEPVDKRRRVA